MLDAGSLGLVCRSEDWLATHSSFQQRWPNLVRANKAHKPLEPIENRPKNATMKTFQGHGICFQYQPNWEFVREVGSDRIDISVMGPGTAMWVVSILQNRPDPEAIVKEVIGSLIDEYATCDVYPSEEAICLLPTVSKDVDFFSHDLITHVHVRACEGETETILLIYQLAAIDEEESYDVLRAMTDSLMLEEYGDEGDEIDDGELPAYRFHNLFADSGVLEPSVSDDEVRYAEVDLAVSPRAGSEAPLAAHAELDEDDDE